MRKQRQMTLPGVKTSVKFFVWSIERNSDGDIIMIMTPVPYDPAREYFYTKAATHRRFVSDGSVVYLVCEWRLSMSDVSLAEILAEWKAGKWTKIDLTSPRKKARMAKS